jgi:hypothetical protein
MPKIYESPDGGQTVYERQIGSTDRNVVTENRDLIIQMREDQLWGQIRRLARTHPGLQAELERVIIFYNLIKDDNR